MTPRYWWQDAEEADEGEVALAPARPSPPPAARPSPGKPDPAQLGLYREALTRKALLLPRASPRRREVEKQLAKITADLLRHELRGGPR